MNIEITHELPENLRDAAVDIHYSAFKMKFIHIYLLTKDEAKIKRIIKARLNWTNAIYAIENGKLLGILGMETKTDKLFHFDKPIMRQEFGAFGTFIRGILFNIFEMNVKKGEVYICDLAVSPDARGKGIGTMLMNKAYEESKAKGFEKLILGVINTNPRAKALYERLGYRTIYKIPTGILTWKAKFTSVDIMEKML